MTDTTRVIPRQGPAKAVKAAEPRTAADDLFDEPPAGFNPPRASPAAPAAQAPARTLDEALPRLAKPFARSLVELRPSALTKDKTRALAAAYVDPRAYQTRLDRVVGPANWSVVYRETLSGVVCRITLYGVIREDVGDWPEAASDPNRMTSAAMQAFKRTCAAFGLGRYLYALPQIWADYDDAKRQIVDVAGVVAQLYARLPAEGAE